MKKLTAKQELKLYQEKLAKLASLAIFCYASQKVSTQFLVPTDFKNSDLHSIVTNFHSIMEYIQDDFKKIAKVAGIDENEIEKISKELIEKFKMNPRFPTK